MLKSCTSARPPKAMMTPLSMRAAMALRRAAVSCGVIEAFGWANRAAGVIAKSVAANRQREIRMY